MGLRSVVEVCKTDGLFVFAFDVRGQLDIGANNICVWCERSDRTANICVRCQSSLRQTC